MLASKGSEILETTKEATVQDALALMAKRNVGSLIIRESGRLAGIITERHFARKVYLAGLADGRR